MANPAMRERCDLSNPTQTAVEGVRDGQKALICRTATRHETFDTDLEDF
jgi:hypothetical protein